MRAQHKLLAEEFSIKSLALVVGGSMGAQQTYEWAVRYPDMVKRAAPIAGTAKNTIHDFLFTETLVDAITSDPGFNRGFYASSADVREGLLCYAKMWAVMGWSTEFFQQERHKALGFSSMDDFVMNFMNGYFSVMDPNDLLCMAWKWQHGDVSRLTGCDLRAALGRIKAKTFVMPMSSDMFFPPTDCQAEWRLIPDAEFRPIQTVDGHLALFGADPNAIAQPRRTPASCLRQKPELQKTFSRGGLLNERPVSGGEACPALTMECGFCAASNCSRRLHL